MVDLDAPRIYIRNLNYINYNFFHYSATGFLMPDQRAISLPFTLILWIIHNLQTGTPLYKKYSE